MCDGKAPGAGVEPTLTASEAGVLPLDDPGSGTGGESRTLRTIRFERIRYAISRHARMVLPVRIELTTVDLRGRRSATELREYVIGAGPAFA